MNTQSNGNKLAFLMLLFSVIHRNTSRIYQRVFVFMENRIQMGERGNNYQFLQDILQLAFIRDSPWLVHFS